jgi:hypothetical protein
MLLGSSRLLLGCSCLLLGRSGTGRNGSGRDDCGPYDCPPSRVTAPDAKDRLRFGHQLHGQTRYIGKEHQDKGNGYY